MEPTPLALRCTLMISLASGLVHLRPRRIPDTQEPTPISAEPLALITSLELMNSMSTCRLGCTTPSESCTPMHRIILTLSLILLTVVDLLLLMVLRIVLVLGLSSLVVLELLLPSRLGVMRAKRWVLFGLCDQWILFTCQFIGLLKFVILSICIFNIFMQSYSNVRLTLTG